MLSLEALDQGSSASDVVRAAAVASMGAPMQPGDPFSAGNIVASPDDMLMLLADLLNARLLGSDRLEAMIGKLHPMFDEGLYYGQGIMAYVLADDLWVGHSGGVPGARAVVAYSVESGVYAAVALTGEGSPESIARVLIGTMAAATKP